MMTLSTNEKIRKAYEWICLAEVNYLACKMIQEKKDPDMPLSKMGDLMILTSNNAFNAAVEIVHALIHSTQKDDLHLKDLLPQVAQGDPGLLKLVQEYEKNLRSAYPYLDTTDFSFLEGKCAGRAVGDLLQDIRITRRTSDGLVELEGIRMQFESQGFHKIRHQGIAHKNSGILYPSGSANKTLYKQTRDEFGEIIKELRIKSCFWFDWSPGNPFLRPVMEDLTTLLQLP